MNTQNETPALPTALPWHVVDTAIYHDFERGESKGSVRIASLDCHPDYVSRRRVAANAAFIVRAVNSHAELVEALKAVCAALTQPVQTVDLTDANRSRLAGVIQNMRGDCVFAVNAAQSALAKGEGQP